MSYKEGKFPLFQYSLEQKEQVLKSYDFKSNLIRDEVDAIVEWFEKQPHLVDAGIDRNVIESLFVNSKCSREKTKRRIENLYKYRELYHHDIMQPRIDCLEQAEDIWSFHHQAILPKLFETKRITITQITDPDPNQFDWAVMCRNILMLADLRLKFDCSGGDIWIVDLKNTELGHVLRLNPITTQQISNFTQDALGFRVDKIHVINAPSWIDKILMCFKPFLSKKIMDRIVLHKDVGSLHKFIPKTYLPKDYDGEEMFVAELVEKTQKLVKGDKYVKNYLIDQTKCMSDRKKRTGFIYEEDCLSGTFRKIELD